MPTQLHSQARMMQYLAIVTSLVTFFRSLGGIFSLTIMSSVVNNKVSSALSSILPPGISVSSSLDSLNAITSLPPNILIVVQKAFSDAIRWAYIALLPFVCIAAISSLFLGEVKVEGTPGTKAKEVQRAAKSRSREDLETGQLGLDMQGEPQHRPRIGIYGPLSLIIWCFQAIGDKFGWRR